MADTTQNGSENRISTLLKIIGADVNHPLISMLDSGVADNVRGFLQDETGDLSPDVIESTLDDFEKFYRFAVETLNLSDSLPLPKSAGSRPTNALAEPNSANENADLKLFSPTGDALEDLKQLNPLQIAGALNDEHPKTIAVVLSQLDKSVAADVLDHIDEELQPQILLLLKQDVDVPLEMLDRVLKTTFEKGSKVEAENVETENADQKIVNMLRALPKKTRNRLIEELKDRDEETVNRLQEMLYVFEDLLLYDNRSVQKVLGAVQTNVLVVALQDADEALCECVFNNLSKRAGDVLKDEMSFGSKASEEEIEMAKKEIAKIIGQQDQEGELSLA